MEAVTFASAEQRRTVIAPRSCVPLILVKTKHFDVANGDRVLLAVNKLKLLALNLKKPDELAVLNRVDGQRADLPMGFPIRHLGFLSPDSNQLYAAGGKTLSLVQAEVSVLGQVSLQRSDAALDADIEAVAATPSGVVALTAAGALVEVTAEAAIAKKFTLKGPLGSSLLCVHRESGLMVVSGRSSALDIVSLSSEKSVLSKQWLPHGEDVPSAVYVLQGKKYGDALCIVTASQRNTELRFWTFVEATGVATLKQQLSITADGASDKAPARLFAVSTTEEQILLPSVDGSGIVVVELDRQAFKASRATDWVNTSTAAYLAAASFVRKTQDGTGLNFELIVIARTDERVVQISFDNARLVGASNLSAADAAAPGDATAAAAVAVSAQKDSNVSRWFGNMAAAPLASPTPTAPTSVSSTISGRAGNSADTALVQAQAAQALRTQASAHRDALSALDAQVVGLQKQASAVMKALQEQPLRDEAVVAGRDFANRNKSRLTVQQQQQSQQQPAASSSPTAQQNDVMQTLNKFTAAIPLAVNDAARQTVKDALAKAIPPAVDKALAQIERQDSELSLPKMSSTESMIAFSNAVDKSNQGFSKLLKNETAALESMTVKIVTSSTERGKAVIQNAKTFLAALATEITGLKADIQEAKVALVESRTSSSAQVKRDPSEIIKGALVSAQAGRWPEAILAVTNTGDAAVIMGFLQDNVVLQSKDVLCDPATLPLSVLVTLLVSIANDIKSQAGNIPFRVGWLSDLLVEWDDTLQAMRADPAKAKLLNGCAEQFELVAQSLGAIDKKTEIDKGTRFNVQLVTKILKQLTGK